MQSESRFTVQYHPKVIEHDIPRLDGMVRRRIKSAIEKKLTLAPEQFAKPLAYTRAGLWSLRVGSWRVIFTLREYRAYVLKIGHRRDVYVDLSREDPENS